MVYDTIRDAILTRLNRRYQARVTLRHADRVYSSGAVSEQSHGEELGDARQPTDARVQSAAQRARCTRVLGSRHDRPSSVACQRLRPSHARSHRYYYYYYYY